MPIKSAADISYIESAAESRLRHALGDMRREAAVNPSRELSLAITSLEQSILWLLASQGSVE